MRWVKRKSKMSRLSFWGICFALALLFKHMHLQFWIGLVALIPFSLLLDFLERYRVEPDETIQLKINSGSKQEAESRPNWSGQLPSTDRIENARMVQGTISSRKG